MYLPASEAVKASFGGVEFTGKVEAGKDENVLEREQTSIDYRKGSPEKYGSVVQLEYAAIRRMLILDEDPGRRRGYL